MEGQITLANHYDKTVEGLLSEQPSQRVKEKFEGLYEALSRKHAMEYARLTTEYKEEVTKDQELHRKMEDMLSMMKDMADKTNL